MSLGNVPAVFTFEWRRALTAGRMLWWLVLAGFPIFLSAVIRVNSGLSTFRESRAFFLFMLVPMLVTMLGTLLWTAPAVSAELERRSWVYIAIRPDGRTAMLLGKYLAGVTWVLPAALVGLVVSVLILRPEDPAQLLVTLACVTVFACLAYGAAYLLIGVLFPHRAMVLAIAYSLIFEVVVSFIPAMVNQLTVQWRLRSLLYYWYDIPFTDAMGFATPPAWVHVILLMIYPLALLAAAMFLIRRREFSLAAETET